MTEQTAEYCLQHELCQEMAKLVEQLTTTGQQTLDEPLMKQFKKICRRSDGYVERAYHLLMSQLEEDHSEIRYSSYLIIEELFKRSHRFRELIISEFQLFLEQVVGTDVDNPLPPPEAVAKKLATKALETIQYWHNKYGESYKKLSLGYNFLKNCKKIDFNNMEARSVAERRLLEEREQKRQIMLHDKMDKARKELDEIQEEIVNCLKEVNSCFKLLLPHLEDFVTDIEMGDNPSSSSVTELTRDDDESALGIAHILSRIDAFEQSHCDNGSERTACSNVDDMCTENLSENTNSANSSCGSSVTSDKLPTLHTCTNDVDTSKTDNVTQASNVISKSNIAEVEICDNGEDNAEQLERSSENEVPETTETDLVHEYGLGSRNYNINIRLTLDKMAVNEDEDNTDILTTLRDQNRLIQGKYLPTVVKCLAIMSKAGAPENEIKAIIDIKMKLEDAKSKFSDLNIEKGAGLGSSSGRTGTADSDDDDDDFEEVPEKEGYEPVIPPHLRKEYGLEPLRSVSMKGKHTPTPRDWDIKHVVKSKEDFKDPTSFAANVAKMHQSVAKAALGKMIKKEMGGKSQRNKQSNSSHGQGSHSSTDSDRKHKLMEKAPVLSFGFDLESWENPNPEGPMVLKNSSLHRWWTPIENDERLTTGDMAILKSRTIKFAGQFVPVKWSCRAPLPNGNLCERMDRVKCPFHGKIIARDDMGVPANLDDLISVKTEELEKKKDEIPAWQDRELQRDIEAATGLDLGSSKGKGKGKKSKYPNLTNLKAAKNTVRNRLEKKVFNKRAVKRVAQALDNFDHKRHRDKFANQFHYSLPS